MAPIRVSFLPCVFQIVSRNKSCAVKEVVLAIFADWWDSRVMISMVSYKKSGYISFVTQCLNINKPENHLCMDG